MKASAFLAVYRMVEPFLYPEFAPRPCSSKENDCFTIGTKLLLMNGKTKAVEEITGKDVLMGDDGTPRKVLGVARGARKLYRVEMSENTKNPLIVTPHHQLVLRRNRSDRAAVDLPRELEILAQKVGTGIEPDENAGNARRFGNTFYYRTDADIPAGILSHLLSLPRSPKAQTRFRNVLLGLTGSKVRSGSCVEFRKVTKKVQSWFWGQTEKAEQEKKARKAKGKSSDQMWENVRVKDEQEAWDKFREFKKKHGWFKPAEINVQKEEKALKKFLKGKEDRPEGYKKLVKGVQGLYVYFPNDQPDLMHFKYTYLDTSEEDEKKKQKTKNKKKNKNKNKNKNNGDETEDEVEEDEEDPADDQDEEENPGEEAQEEDKGYGPRTHYYYVVDPDVFDTLPSPKSSTGERAQAESGEDKAAAFLAGCEDLGTKGRIDQRAKDDVRTIKVKDYFELDDDEKRKWWLFQCDALSFGFDDATEEEIRKFFETLPVDPYFLGLWLGDGTEGNTDIANNHEPEVVGFLRRYAETMGMKLSHNPAYLRYGIVSKTKKEKEKERDGLSLDSNAGSAQLPRPRSAPSQSTDLTYITLDNTDEENNEASGAEESRAPRSDQGSTAAISRSLGNSSSSAMSIEEEEPTRSDRAFIDDADVSTRSVVSFESRQPSSAAVSRSLGNSSSSAMSIEEEEPTRSDCAFVDDADVSARPVMMEEEEPASEFFALDDEVPELDDSLSSDEDDSAPATPIVSRKSLPSTVPLLDAAMQENQVDQLVTSLKSASLSEHSLASTRPNRPLLQIDTTGNGVPSVVPSAGNFSPIGSEPDVPAPEKSTLPPLKTWQERYPGMTDAEIAAIKPLSLPSSQRDRSLPPHHRSSAADSNAAVDPQLAAEALKARDLELLAARGIVPLDDPNDLAQVELKEEEDALELDLGGADDFQRLGGIDLTEEEIDELVDEVVGTEGVNE
ncbi:uncharacterized protein JCM6883_003613 [Sporobolomyces salmoneus]|uniref:uncharacterized protein n=1 Tax=Sporobolomyces salmoneus TaxID=183962 RepID=UPI0031807C12